MSTSFTRLLLSLNVHLIPLSIKMNEKSIRLWNMEVCLSTEGHMSFIWLTNLLVSSSYLSVLDILSGHWSFIFVTTWSCVAQSNIEQDYSDIRDKLFADAVLEDFLFIYWLCTFWIYFDDVTSPTELFCISRESMRATRVLNVLQSKRTTTILSRINDIMKNSSSRLLNWTTRTSLMTESKMSLRTTKKRHISC